MNLPYATVGVFLNGVDRPEILSLAETLGFRLTVGHNYGTNAYWDLWWLRMLNFFESSNSDVCFKFDPDTMVDATPLSIPIDDYFGCISGNREYIRGGAIGISKTVVRAIVEKELLELTAEEIRSWLNLTTPHFAEDRALACLLRHIGVCPVHWPECRCRWRKPIRNDPLKYAIVHPRYYT